MIVVKDHGLNQGAKISTIKLMAEYHTNKKEIKALYTLLGGYNEIGRHIDLETFKQKQAQFNRIVQELAESF